MPLVDVAPKLNSPTEVAAALGRALDERGQDYAFGGAVALAYWAEPRTTMDVDLTLFVPPDRPVDCIRTLQAIGCDVPVAEATALLDEHAFCRAKYGAMRVDVFFPSNPFYETARTRRQRVPLKDGSIIVWDAETLAVFKMMFFREKDFVDLKQILRHRLPNFDREWVRMQLVEICGARDIRVARWDEVVEEVQP
jgi:hypothetical protein